MPNSLPTKQLKACVAKHIDVSPDELKLTPISTGRFNRSYYVSLKRGDYVLRIAPSDQIFCLFYERHMMRQEPGLHTLLHDKTSTPIPKIYAFDDTHEIVDSDFLLMERLQGTTMSEARGVNSKKVLQSIGKCLRQVHALTAETYGYLGEHRPMTPQNTWVEAFVIMWNKLIDDVEASGHYNDNEASFLRRLLDDHLSVFDHSVTSCLLHMDIWVENILVDSNSRLTGLIDWDRALWGDPEIEFAVLDYCGISQPAFWEGYGRTRDQSAEAQIRKVFYFLYELQKYIPIRHFRGNDPALARSYKKEVMSVVRRAWG